MADRRMGACQQGETICWTERELINEGRHVYGGQTGNDQRWETSMADRTGACQ